jgi:hypothetical protein
MIRPGVSFVTDFWSRPSDGDADGAAAPQLTQLLSLGILATCFLSAAPYLAA